jgi:hypothetical protein
MTRSSEDIFKKIVSFSDEIKKNLRKKGMIAPVNNQDGSIGIGAYTVIKNSNGFYTVIGRGNEVAADQINLPQTAILLANDLALGKFLDKDLKQKDQMYGYALFEETLLKKIIDSESRVDLQQFDLTMTKYLIAKSKKEFYRNDIINSFEKLRKLINNV